MMMLIHIECSIKNVEGISWDMELVNKKLWKIIKIIKKKRRKMSTTKNQKIEKMKNQSKYEEKNSVKNSIWTPMGNFFFFK